MNRTWILLLVPALAGAATGSAPVAPSATAQAAAQATDDEGLPIPSPPEESPPAPPATPPAPPPQQQQQQASPAPPATAGQWVYTQQYGWLWMPYGDSYAYVPPSGSGQPYAYVYYPSYAAWTWVVAPWIWGWGAWPYFGYYGPYHYAWYNHGYWRHPAHWHYVAAPYRGPAGAFHAGHPGYYGVHRGVPVHGAPPTGGFGWHGATGGHAPVAAPGVAHGGGAHFGGGHMGGGHR